jgi:hypothetical protein
MDGTASVISRGINQVDIFTRGPLNHLYYKAWVADPWDKFPPPPAWVAHGHWVPSHDGWDDLGGDVWGTPAVATWGPDRIDVVVGSVNADGNTFGIFHKAWDGTQWIPGQTNWENLGGAATKVPPVAVSWGPGRLDIFAVGPNSNLFHKAGMAHSGSQA